MEVNDNHYQLRSQQDLCWVIRNNYFLNITFLKAIKCPIFFALSSTKKRASLLKLQRFNAIIVGSAKNYVRG